MKISLPDEKAPLLRALPSRLLGQTALVVGHITGDALAKSGSHRHQFAVLATLAAFGPSSQADLGRRTDLDRSDINSIIATLTEKELVAARRDPENRRRNIVELTKAGEVRLKHLTDVVAAAQNEAFAPLTEAERQELVRLLMKLQEGLG